MDGKGDSLGIVQEIEISPYNKIVYAKPIIHPGEWEANGSNFPGQTTRSSDSQQKKKKKKKKKRKITCGIVDFAIPMDHKVKIKENKMRDKCLDLA